MTFLGLNLDGRFFVDGLFAQEMRSGLGHLVNAFQADSNALMDSLSEVSSRRNTLQSDRALLKEVHVKGTR